MDPKNSDFVTKRVFAAQDVIEDARDKLRQIRDAVQECTDDDWTNDTADALRDAIKELDDAEAVLLKHRQTAPCHVCFKRTDERDRQHGWKRFHLPCMKEAYG